jgi:cytochrome c553
MENLADGLTDREIAALASYYSSLRPQGRRPGHATAEEPWGKSFPRQSL